jgi:hypothetical protein
MGALQRALSDVTAAMAQALEERVEVKGAPGALHGR